MHVADLLRRDLESLEPQSPPAPEGAAIKLDQNENPYGPSPLVRAAVAACCLERYPASGYGELRRHLGDYLGVPPECIFVGSGGDDILDTVARLALEPGDEVIDCVPSFVMYPAVTRFHRGAYRAVPRDRRFAVDVEAVERAVTPRTRLIFLCSPNNPTGNSTPLPDIERVLALGPLVLLDEAYAEFAGSSHIDLLRRYPNLIVLRTMSKWAALAGLRLGYAAADPALAAAVDRVKPPFNVGAAAVAAAIASLQDREYLMANVQRIIAERERLRARLDALPSGRAHPSDTNFLFWTTGYPHAPVPARALAAEMARRGVLVRPWSEPVDALRIAVGTPGDSEALRAALEGAYAALAG